jgi:hypothetical protein
VDTEAVLENAKVLDNYGNRIQRVKHLLYEYLQIPAEEGELPARYEVLWRGCRRTCEILFRNVRELALDSLKSLDGNVADRHRLPIRPAELLAEG